MMLRRPLQLLISVSALATIWFVAWLDYGAHTKEHRDQFDRLGEALLEASEGTIVRLCRGGRYDPAEMNSALEELLISFNATRIALASESAGALAEATLPDSDEVRAVRRFSSAFTTPKPRGQGRRRLGPPGMDEFPKGELRLELDLSTELLEARLAGDFRRFLGLASALTIALLLSLVLVALRERSVILAEDLGRVREELRGLEFLRRLGAGLAHETRNPLGILRGFAQELATGKVPVEHIPTLANTIIEEADRTVSRLDEFMLLSRPAELRRESFDLHVLLTELGALLQPDLEAVQATLQIDDFQLVVHADKEQTRRLFMNLMLNGAQALGPGGVLRIGGRRTGSAYDVCITDDGPGVPSELRETLFEPYVSKRESGTGLGLAIVQRIATEHGWEVSHTPVEPHGAAFTVRVSEA